MRFLELNLLAFGPFSKRTLDFSGDGFHLVFGPNEAGKSSALRAIDALLFGVPRRTDDDFIHKKTELQIGATIVNSAGRELRFVRRKRDKKTLVTFDKPERILAENSLDNFLKGMGQERFRRLYCINHDEFRAGGHLMRQLQGLANDSLVAASHGRSFNEVENALQTAADELWAAKKRSTKIKKGIAEYDSAKREKRELEVRVQHWKSLREELDKYLQRKKEIVEFQTRLDTEKRHLERLRDAMPKLAQLKGLNDELAGHDAQILPQAYSVEQRRGCAAELAATRKRIGEVEQKLCRLTADIESASELPHVVQAADSIDQIQQRIDSYRQLFESLPDLQRERDEAFRKTAQWLTELGESIEPDAADTLRVPRELRAAIYELSPKEQSLRERPNTISGNAAKLQTELQAIEQQLSDSNEARDMRLLDRSWKEGGPYLRIEKDLVKARAELKQSQTSVRRKLQRLPGWTGALESLQQVPVPLRESIEQFAQRFLERRHDVDSIQQRLASTREELAEIREEIAASQRSSSVVTEDDLASARRLRNDGWDLIKRAWLHDDRNDSQEREFAGDEPLQNAFENRTLEADSIADRLRREAERVGQLTKQMEREQRLDVAQKEMDRQLDRAKAEETRLVDAWHALWAECGIEPRSPHEMGAWLDRYHEVLQQSEEISRLQAEIEKSESDVSEYADDLASVIRTHGDLGDDVSLQQMLALAEELLESEQRRESQHEAMLKDRDRIKSELSRTRPLLDQARVELRQWESQWNAVMARVGCDPNTTGAQAIARLSTLDELATAHDAWRRLDRQAADAQQHVDQFTADVLSITKRLLPEKGELPTLEQATELRVRLVEARKLDQAALARREQFAELEQERLELKSRAAELHSNLARFLALANAESLDGLDEIEGLSQLASERASLQTELQQMSGGTALAEFLAQAEGSNADELSAKIGQLDDEIQDQRRKRDEVVSQITEIEAEMDQVDGSDAAARADQRAMHCLAEVYEDAHDFLRLKIAATILRQQVERYREENKDPLLARASQFFSEMTAHEFIGLESDYDDSGQQIIVGVRHSGDKVHTQEMSDGTLDPLFLSLRLAYLHDKLQQFEPMPLIVDDILIHLDDERALATLRVLADFSKQTQILFFTHHHRLRELAELHLPSDLLTVHELQRRGSELLESRKPK